MLQMKNEFLTLQEAVTQDSRGLVLFFGQEIFPLPGILYAVRSQQDLVFVQQVCRIGLWILVLSLLKAVICGTGRVIMKIPPMT